MANVMDKLHREHKGSPRKPATRERRVGFLQREFAKTDSTNRVQDTSL